MKMRLFAGPLADAVAFVARALPAKPAVPVLAGILLATDTDGPHVSAFDYEVAAATRLDAEIAGDGRALVSGRLLNEIAKSLPKDAEVDIELTASRLLVTSGAARFTLPTLPVEEYPALPAAPDTVFTVTADDFADATAQAFIAAGRDDSTPAMTGIQLQLNGDVLTLAATDRYRFGVRDLTVHPTGTVPAASKAAPKTKGKAAQDQATDAEAQRRAAFTALVPAASLADAAKALAGEHPLRAGWSQGQLVLAAGRRTFLCRLLEGYEFPRFVGMLPDLADAEVTITVDTAHAADAIKRVALVAAANTPIRLVADGQHLRLEAGSGDDAQATERIPAQFEGTVSDGLTIAFNPGFLADALRAIAAPEVRIGITEPTKPAALAGAGGDSTDLEYRHTLMPVRLSS
ncbi:DNA polymerase III subunit beta [Kitasatospora sp. NPDC086009]|uniref:DNA polymerase III subunit beta n=1 Tax=unclassified Kitasatospora TaxID=2633591 RepID=UPI0037CBEB38